MVLRAALCLTVFLVPTTVWAQVPEDFALWLEQVPGTTEVLVVGSWAVDDVQGWSWGVRHDPHAVRVGSGDRVEFPEDYMTMYHGSPPGFASTGIHENGVTQGVVVDLCACPQCCLAARHRFEMLQISYSVLAEPAVLAFSDALGDPPVQTAMVHQGALILPAVQNGLVLSTESSFVRGDANADGAVDIADAVFLLQYLFRGYGRVPCRAAGDATDDGQIDIADPIRIVEYLFRDHGPLPMPFPLCGSMDAGTTTYLDCITFPPCP